MASDAAARFHSTFPGGLFTVHSGSRHDPSGPGRFAPGTHGSIFYATSEASKPVYGNGQITHALTTKDGASPSVAWGVDIITYSIGTGAVDSADAEYTSEMDGYAAMTPAMEAAAREAFELWDEVIAVELMEVQDWPDAHITFNYSSNTGNSTYASYGYWLTDNAPRSDYKMADADIWLATGWSSHDQDSDLYQGGYGILTYLHEIGHAIGISHPGDYNGSASYELDATHYQDTRQYTVMSYFQAYENGSGTDHVGTNGMSYGATPLLNDILTAQAIYGADMTTRTGNTTYGFNSTAGRAAFDFTVNLNPVIAIWDAGGIDRLDASGWNTNQVLDLNDGAFSSLGELTNNVAIAWNAVIEQAVGGGGNDRITGNEVANLLIGNGGNDTLSGGGGNDTLQGGNGHDTLVGGAGADRLEGGNGRDLVDYSAAGAAVTVNLNSGSASGGSASGDILSLVEDILGTPFADSLTGNGADNLLSGGEGNDALIGGAGNDTLLGGGGADFLSGSFGTDTLNGGEGNDVLRGGEDADLIDGGGGYDWLLYNTAPAAVSVNLGTGAGLAGEALGDVITGVEHMIGTAHADTLTGDGANNYLLGGEGADTLDGGGGDDTLKGQGGNDTLYGSAGIDVLIGGTGADALHGGADGDWASYIEAAAGVSASLASGGLAGEALGDSYDSIENLWGSLFADTLTGDAQTNLIRGDNGNDTIRGGGGDDVLIGGNGADLFLFYDGDGVDRINGLVIGTDLIRITGAAMQFADLTIGSFSGSATVTYDPGDTIVLSGIDPSLVTADMFVFG